MRDRNECAYCDTSLKIVSYEAHGERFCSAACVDRYEREVARYQLSLQLQPTVEEIDACECRRCTGPP